MTSRVIRGHGLVAEGSPHDSTGRRIGTGWGFSTDGPGHALCACGILSDDLPSRHARRAWHRDHKDAVLEQLAAAR